MFNMVCHNFRTMFHVIKFYKYLSYPLKTSITKRQQVCQSTSPGKNFFLIWHIFAYFHFLNHTFSINFDSFCVVLGCLPVKKVGDMCMYLQKLTNKNVLSFIFVKLLLMRKYDSKRHFKFLLFAILPHF